ncbi:MAG: VWA domain-containing protein [Actinobacteria bacterium]|nr:VWA domain-containing protein [Actinomycetota bacterium]
MGWKEAFRRLPAERVQPSAMAGGWGQASAALTKAALSIVGGVLVKCYPKASAPVAGLVNRLTNVILLDGELLGCTPEEIPAEPDGDQLKALVVVLGVLFHECGHVKHTPTPRAMQEIPEELLERAKWLEEGRMEARLIEGVPRVARYLRAAITKLLLEHRPEDPLAPMSRARAVKGAVLICSRVPAGNLRAADVLDSEARFTTVLGAEDLETVKEIVAEVCAAPDRDAIAALTEGARRLAELAPTEEEEAGGAGGGGPGEEAEGGEGGAAGDGDAPSWEEASGPLAVAERSARAAAVELDPREGGVDPELRKLAREIAEGGAAASRRLALFRGHGFGLGPGIPETGGRPPVAIERTAARRLAHALQEARSKRLVREGRVIPPGRFSGRGAMRQASELERGAPIRGLAFATRRTVLAELWQPVVGIAVDVSGSMGPFEGPLASVAWVVHTAVEQVGGRAAVSLFGDEAKLLCRAGRRLGEVPEVSAVGGSEDVGEGIELLRAVLPLFDRRRPRLLFLVGDGVWVSAPWAEAGERNISELRASGCGVVSIGIGSEPVTHGESALVSVGVPLEIAAVIGSVAVEALGAR